MTPEQVSTIVFQVIVFLFAISVHESAHAWTALQLGDSTAYMVGRVSLNPLKHIDMLGTLILPLLCVVIGFPGIIGWAKPTPVNTRNFKHLVRDDILTAVAGPVSNLIVATAAVLALTLIKLLSRDGHDIVQALAFYNGRAAGGNNSILLPISLLLYQAMFINVLLAVFNLIPIPPLDGSHVLRHFLSPGAQRIYDMAGMVGMILIFYLARGFLGVLMSPVITAFRWLLLSF